MNQRETSCRLCTPAHRHRQTGLPWDPWDPLSWISWRRGLDLIYISISAIPVMSLPPIALEPQFPKHTFPLVKWPSSWELSANSPQRSFSLVQCYKKPSVLLWRFEMRALLRSMVFGISRRAKTDLRAVGGRETSWDDFTMVEIGSIAGLSAPACSAHLG